MPFDSYAGIVVRLRYCVNVIIKRPYGGNLTKEEDFLVNNSKAELEDENPAIKMKIGLENMLDLELAFEKSKYHLKDAIVGTFKFNHFGFRICHMELCLVKKESFAAN